MVLPQLLAELICQGLLFGLFGGTGSSSKPSTTLATPEHRRAQQARICAFDGCNALSFRSTDHCWRHQDEPPSDPDLDQVVDSWVPEPEPEAECNWWEEQTE